MGGSLEEPSVETAVVLDAVLFRLLVIGEAVKHIDDEVRAAEGDVPWSRYAGLRDIVVHRYFRVQTKIIEDTVRRDLQRLRAAVENRLPR